MTRIPMRGALGFAIAATMAAIGIAGPAQANTTLPGLNGKIAFTSTRDFPFVVDSPLRGFLQDCGPDALSYSCSDEIYSMDPVPNGAATRLTNNTDGDDEAAWLPADGASIAFESDRAQGPGVDCKGCLGWDIWSMAGDGSNATQLTTDPGNETRASYSPDGTHIAYMGNTPDVTVGADRLFFPNPPQIYIMPAGGESAGTPAALLPAGQTGLITDTQTTLLEYQDGYPSYSPDGNTIAFTRFTIGATSSPPASPDASKLGNVDSLTLDARTYLAPASGGGPATAVETYPVCTVSAASGAAAKDALSGLSSAFATGSVKSFSRALHSRLKELPGCLYDFKPTWSPDGSKLAVTRVSSMGTIGPLAPRGGLTFTQVDPGDVVVIPVANPAAEVNLSNVSEPSDCGQLDSGGAPTTAFCSLDEDPSWSPDGTKIVFDSDRLPDGTSNESFFGGLTDLCFDGSTGLPNGTCDYELYTMNVDGSAVTQLTNNSFDDFNPDWQRIPPPPPAPPAPVTPAAVPPKVGVAGVRRACVSKSFHVRFHIATTSSSVKSVVVKLDGKRIKSTTKGGFTLTINARKLSSGRHRLTITATDSNGHVTTTHKSFSVCKAAKPRKRTAPRFTG